LNYFKPSSLIKNLYGPNLIWSVKGKANTVYLTFDDGPIPEVTPDILNILDKYNVKATFFCVGHNVFKNPETLKMVDKMQNQLEDDLEVVGTSFSLADYINRMNKVMNADDEAFNTIPDSQDMVAQYLLLYEMSGDPENLDKVVDYDYEKLNVTFQLKSDNSKAINSALAIINTYEDDFSEMGRFLPWIGQLARFTLSLLIVQGSSVLDRLLRSALVMLAARTSFFTYVPPRQTCGDYPNDFFSPL